MFLIKRTLLLLFLLLGSAFTFSQDQKPTSTEAPKFVPPSVRLKEAKAVYMKNGGGSEIPFNVIESGMEGWGRYTLVDSPEKADLIVEVASPMEDTGVSVTSKTSTESGHMEKTTKSTRDLTVGQIKLTVFDARNRVPLWSATEKPKGAFKQKNREDNLVESAQKLVRKFRERVEPQTAQ